MTHGHLSKESPKVTSTFRGISSSSLSPLTSPSMDWTSDQQLLPKPPPILSTGHQGPGTVSPHYSTFPSPQLAHSLLTSQQSVQRLSSFTDFSLGLLSYEGNGKKLKAMDTQTKPDAQGENNNSNTSGSASNFGVRHSSKLSVKVGSNSSIGGGEGMMEGEKMNSSGTCDSHLPSSITEVDPQVTESGIAVYSGYADSHGSRLVGILCRHDGWSLEQVTTKELTNLFLYYRSLPKGENRNKGFTLIVEARGATLPIINQLLETIYMIHETCPDAIAIVHLLADRQAQSLLFRSPVFQPQLNIKIDLVTSLETLYKFVPPPHLPSELGGQLQHNHRQWVVFRRQLDPLLMECQRLARHLVDVMSELSRVDRPPDTLEETRAELERHERLVREAMVLREEQLQALDCHNVMARCLAMETELKVSLDYRESMEYAQCLIRQIEETSLHAATLADTRRLKLQQCLQLRLFEDEASQVIGWLDTEGEKCISLHSKLSSGIKAIRQQQKEFDKFYFAATTQTEKGKDMVDEACLLAQCSDYEEVPGLKELTQKLKNKVKYFMTKVDSLKDKIADAAKCYFLLDKSQEWALDATKYVTSMKTETTVTPELLDKLSTSLNLYLREHPQLPDSSYTTMLELACKLEDDNDKLPEMCRVAQSRCTDISNMLKTRQQDLQKARNQLQLEEQRRASLAKSHASPLFGPDLNEPVWSPHTDYTDSVESMMALRRRSYAGQPSAPIYSPAAQAFRDGVRDVNLSECEERLFREGLITEDLSDRVVTSLPKGLSSSVMRSSRESLHGSKENLRNSSDNISREQKSNSFPREMSSSFLDFGEGQVPPQSARKSSRPLKKFMRRTQSVLTGAEGEVLDHQTAAEHIKSDPLHVIGGSSESLPSMPEEEDLANKGEQGGGEEQENVEGGGGGGGGGGLRSSKFQWSPLPVNTTLARQHGTLQSYHSMADLRLTDEEMKRRRTLELIMREMIDTEQHYVRSLSYVVDHYIPELLRDDVPQPLRGKRNVIFGNLEQIHTFHSQYFLTALEQCEVQPFQICHCFLQHAQEFYLYALYNKNKPKSDELMSEYGAKFFKRKQQKLSDRMDLSSYLLKPVQRMGKYALLLKQIIKECPETEPEHADLKSALEMVKFQLRHGNDLLVMDSLRECDVNLQEQGRLLRQDEFLVWVGRRKCVRRVFLFEELILFSKTKRSTSGHDIYIYKNAVKMSDIGLTENVADSQFKFEIWFRRRTDGATTKLQAPNMDVKSNWIRDVSRLLWKQAIKNRELRLQEMARMGIGRKPCLDLKPSEDNINDRFVRATSTNKVARSRNSIAVSTFEHLKNGNKRPHSIISVSSTSSSNSSQSSSGLPQPATAGTPLLLHGATQMAGGGGSTEDGHFKSPQRSIRTLTLYTPERIVEAPSSPTSPSSATMTDSCTQTTLKRPPRAPRHGSSSSSTISLTPTSQPHSLSTDV